MKPLIQTKLHNPPHQNGNCMAACLASLLEIEITDVPKFEDEHEKEWYFSVLKWLSSLGYYLVYWEEEIHWDGYHIAIGPSPRGNFSHCVIYKGKQMVHDPHPSGDGLLSITETEALVPFNPVQRKENK